MLRRFGIILLAAIAAQAVHAYSPSESLETLALQADRISLGTVESIQEIEGYRLAYIREERVLSGGFPTTFYLSLRPTYLCDVTSTHVGERALFLLSDRQSEAEDINYPQIAATHYVRKQELIALQLSRKAVRVRRRIGNTPVYGVMLAGRGLMPLHDQFGTTLATLWNDVVIPNHFITFPTDQSFIQQVPLVLLEALISESLRCAEASPA